MKNTIKTNHPLFKGCPEAHNFDSLLHSDCCRCKLYNDCIKEKERRLKKRHAKKIKRRLVSVFLICIILTALTIIKIYFTASADVKEDDIVYVPEIKITIDTISPVTNISNEPETNACEVNTLEKPQISAYNPGNSYYYNISKEDKKFIERLLYKEARGESYQGKVAVAAVVLNRYFSNDPRFNRESIYSVITQPAAFAPIDDVTQSMLNTVPDLALAVEDACKGWDPTRKVFEDGALFFYAPKIVSGYQKEIREGIQVLEIGNHNFHNDFNEK
ncbi:MAG: hypothetical protein HFJ45_10365 [Clostridia bacterium]|nr:hypothetical protein [Clostridia bacterium]